MSDQQLGTVVIGGSQAGLAVGYYLKQHGLPFVILDENDRVAGTGSCLEPVHRGAGQGRRPGGPIRTARGTRRSSAAALNFCTMALVSSTRARIFFFYATGITPAMAVQRVGAGSAYAAAFVDAKGHPMDGGKTYRLHLPPNIPAKQFWSLVLYDTQTRSMLQTDQQFPSISSQKKGVAINPDTSVDVYFGPTPPPGKESNWVQTWPGKGWTVILRLYGPLQPFFDKTWRPSEIEEVR